ncbi:ribonuclease D [Halioglobus maricola]|uniref:Ribonuclease D n=1 Tax=Halioglobus maricola TaxID=2601894 RepID=A0A5P9NJW8_9GAMM|nr:ribonuclease D [Halioglobus maricola]QFU76163.1 ribonuclease D [Halioglobus maricola]
MDWKLIESDEALANLIAASAGCTAVMVDTEFMRRNTFFPQVAVVQLCFDGSDAAGTAWLIDPLEITDPTPLAELLQDPSVVKVLHSASEDLEVFQRWLGTVPQPLFDTQKAAAFAGLEFGMGYRALILELCQEDLPKGETRSDWLKRPLTESQCHYAAQDVIYLLSAYTQLAKRCHDLGRYDWVLRDGADAATSLATAAPDYYKRIKSAWKLQPRELAVLVAVSAWREEVARERDKPRSWIIDDKACLQLAQFMPANMDDLRQHVELPPAVLRKRGEVLLDLVDAQQQVPETELPARLPPPLEQRQRDQLKALKKRTAAIADELGLPPQVLLAAKDYELLLRPGAAEPLSWQGWREAVVVEPLKKALQRGEM